MAGNLYNNSTFRCDEISVWIHRCVSIARLSFQRKALNYKTQTCVLLSFHLFEPESQHQRQVCKYIPDMYEMWTLTVLHWITVISLIQNIRITYIVVYNNIYIYKWFNSDQICNTADYSFMRLNIQEILNNIVLLQYSVIWFFANLHAPSFSLEYTLKSLFIFELFGSMDVNKEQESTLKLNETILKLNPFNQ